MTNGTDVGVVDDQKKIFAVDMGYSFCKNMDGNQAFKFPTAIVSKKASGFEADLEEGLYEFEGRQYRVGEDALKFDSKKYERDVTFILKYAPVLVAHAFKLAGVEGMPDCLVVGLPLQQYYRHQDELKKRLKKFMVNGQVFEFKDVKVFMQGFGALADYITTKNPNIEEDGYLFDVGFNTVISLRYHGLKPQQEGSKQYDQFGISRPLEELINVLDLRHKYKLDLISLNAAFLKGSIRGDVGGEINIKALAAPIMEEYLEDLFGALRNDFGRYFNESQRLILSGGGAYYLQGLVSEEYQKKLWVPEQPEYANVRGYYQIGR